MINRSSVFFASVVRALSTKPVTNGEIKPYICNRNPRNLELLRIEKKPCGYPLDNVNLQYWYKLELHKGSFSISAKLIHNTKRVVVKASTSEWAIYKHLFSKTDKMAFVVLGRVFAERCLESGFYSFYCKPKQDDDVSGAPLFFKVLLEEGLTLKELPEFDIHSIWRRKREKKPWTVLED